MKLGKIRLSSIFCAVVLLVLGANPARPQQLRQCKGHAVYHPGLCGVGCSETGSGTAGNDPTCTDGCAITWSWTYTCPNGDQTGGGSDTIACGTVTPVEKDSTCGSFDFTCTACPP